MARYTKVYGDFVQRTTEVRLLTSRAAGLERSKNAFKLGKEIDALCRGSVVLLSSHIEGYVKELGESLLDAIYQRKVCRSRIADDVFYHASKERLQPIRDGAGAANISASVFAFLAVDGALWSKSDRFPSPIPAEEFNKGFANPKVEKVRGYIARFGYLAFKRDLYRTLAKDAVSVCAQVDQIVDTRNAIAHGEVSATKTPSEVKDMIAAATAFCRATDVTFAKWCAAEICPIR